MISFAGFKCSVQEAKLIKIEFKKENEPIKYSVHKVLQTDIARK